MKTIRKFIMAATAIGLALLLSGCSVIDYHPYDTRFDGATGINARNVAPNKRVKPGDVLSLALGLKFDIF